MISETKRSANAAVMTFHITTQPYVNFTSTVHSISGLVVEYIVAIDVTRVRFPADALLVLHCGVRCWRRL